MTSRLEDRTTYTGVRIAVWSMGPQVVGIAYIAAFAPDKGESVAK